MKKTILDELLNEDIFLKNNEEEDKILFPLIDEINLISSSHLKSFVRSVLLKAENFWKIPSSFSDKYHPIDEHGVGGNVLHTKRVVRAAKIISESYVLDVQEKDLVYTAALLHDVTKGKKKPDSEECIYDPFHPYTVEKFIDWCIEEDKKYTSEKSSTTLYLDKDTVNTVLRLIRCHLGPWSPVPETIPSTHAEMIVHLADNIASKLHVIVDGETIIEHRWKPNDK
jgi:HD superfamily phosphohydrolase YqeK